MVKPMTRNGQSALSPLCGDPVISHLMMDVDGVVVAGRPADGRPWKAELENDLGVSPQVLHDAFFAPYWREIVTGKRDLRRTLAAVLAASASQVQADRLIAYWFANDARRNVKVLQDMDDLRQAGVNVCFATNQDACRAAYLWDDLALCRHADRMFSSSDLGVAKPDPEFFLKVAQRTGAQPSSHLLVDDSAENVDAALASGWRAYHWTGDERLRDVVSRLAGR